MTRTLWLIGLLVVAGYLFSTAVVVVQEGELVVISQFGRPVRTIDTAGASLKLPDPVETPIRLDQRLQLLDTSPIELVTRDRRNLILGGFVLWRIAGVEAFLESVHTLEAARGRLEDLVNAELGVAVGRVPLDAFLTAEQGANRISGIMEEVTAACHQAALREFGIEVVMVRLQHLGFPQQNLKAIYRRMMAERERLEKRYRAEGQEEAAKIRATTEREVRELLAEAYRESQVVRGKGEAEAARIYAEAYALDPDFYRLTRSLEAYRKIIGDNATLLLSTESPLFDHLVAPPVTR